MNEIEYERRLTQVKELRLVFVLAVRNERCMKNGQGKEVINLKTKKYALCIYEDQTLSRTIESETPFLPINLNDTLTCGDSRVRYGHVRHVDHWVGPLSDSGIVRHEMHVYCEEG